MRYPLKSKSNSSDRLPQFEIWLSVRTRKASVFLERRRNNEESSTYIRLANARKCKPAREGWQKNKETPSKARMLDLHISILLLDGLNNFCKSR